MPQQIYLSDSSFASNIAFGIPDHLIDMARVKKASEQAQIDDLIRSAPDGYSTIVGMVFALVAVNVSA